MRLNAELESPGGEIKEQAVFIDVGILLICELGKVSIIIVG